MSHALEILVPLAPFILAFMIVRMRHEQKMRSLGLNSLNAAEQQAVAELHSLADRLEARVGALERVLDTELAGWRSRMPL